MKHHDTDHASRLTAKPRNTRRKDNGTREEFDAHFAPENGAWRCLLTDLDGIAYEGDGATPAIALNDAHGKFQDARGRSRTKVVPR